MPLAGTNCEFYGLCPRFGNLNCIFPVSDEPFPIAPQRRDDGERLAALMLLLPGIAGPVLEGDSPVEADGELGHRIAGWIRGWRAFSGHRGFSRKG